jgi:hypothetical protein
MESANKNNYSKEDNHKYLSPKNIEIILDYYSNSIITNFKKEKKATPKLNFAEYFDMSTKAKKEFYEYTPYGLALLNVFNFESAVKKKMFYTPEVMREVLGKFFRLDLGLLKENIMSVYYLAFNTVKSYFKLNFHPLMVFNHSIIYSLGFLNFLKTNDINNG